MNNQPLLEQLLRMKISTQATKESNPFEMTPDFRVAVQEITEDGVRIIIHANGYSSDTCDFMVRGNNLTALFND